LIFPCGTPQETVPQVLKNINTAKQYPLYLSEFSLSSSF
jgi:hypothetical protein